MKQFVVKKQIDVNADISSVWSALTTPEKTKQYFFNCEVCSDWKVGSPITFKGTMLLVKQIEMKGTILAIEPGKLLKYDLVNSGSGDHQSVSTVTDELSHKDGVTTLSITDDVGGGEGAQERFDKSETGWDTVLAGLKEFVEKAE
jgi:uncharacterized protein YndB with AHSA1/START domain